MQNSLKYAKVLEDAGLPRNVAETHIQILIDVMGDEMATKNDINAVQDNISVLRTSTQSSIENLRTDTQNSIESLRVDTQNNFNKVKNKITTFEQKIHYEMQSLEQRIVLKLGGLVTATMAAGITVMKFMAV